MSVQDKTTDLGYSLMFWLKSLGPATNVWGGGERHVVS